VDAGLWIEFENKTMITDLPGPIRSIALSAPFTRLKVAVALDNGGVIAWPRLRDRGEFTRFGEGMEKPVIGFSRGGNLVAATTSEFRVYSTDQEKLKLIATGQVQGGEPIAVLSAAALDEFAIVTRTGEVRVYV
jgi:hypothetical protein